MAAGSLYRPPAPVPRGPLVSLLRVARRGDGNLLELVPAQAYDQGVTWLGWSRRSILLVNDPELVRDVLTDPLDIFPKNDLMVGALAPLVGDSIFVSHGERWRRQRAMIDPAFTHMRIGRAFAAMDAAVADCERRLEVLAATGAPFSLDATMIHLTADVICRTIFSRPLETTTARAVFEDFMVFERSVASVDLWQLIFGRPWAEVPQPRAVLDACERIRTHIGDLLDPRLAAARCDGDAPQEGPDDIVAALLRARDPETGAPFTREELIDQIGVLFLAGHETTASVLVWAFFVLSQQPAVAQRLRDEVRRVCGDDPVAFEHVRRLAFTRGVFREALRLYPPITFIPRVAAEATRIGEVRVRRGAMIMLSPWTAHRNTALWPNADRFDPDRFVREEEPSGPFLSFGLGPRVCVGAAFGTVEATLVLARLVRRFTWETLDPDAVRPVARLTTRPAQEIRCRVRIVQGATGAGDGGAAEGEAAGGPQGPGDAGDARGTPAPDGATA